MLTKDDLKAIVDTISPLIDARAKTTETLIKGEITSSEERVSERIQEIKEELRAEIWPHGQRQKQICSLSMQN